MTKAFITGINGFVGQWLTEFLLTKNMTVYGIDLQDVPNHPEVKYRCSDILDEPQITSFIRDTQPDLLFNLAAISFLPDAAASPRGAINANISGAMIILDAVRNVSPQTRVLLVGSSREYSYQKGCEPLTEESPVNPTNFYGISKLSGEQIGLQYHRQYNIDVRCTRSFNHTGPGQAPRFVCSEWARKVAQISNGLEDPVLSVGGLETRLDFSDVRDVAAAYWNILAEGVPGETYNVCSGSGTNLRWILDYLTSLSSKKIQINTSVDKVRSADHSLCIVGNYKKLSDHTGWQPSVPLSTTLDDLYKWWCDTLT